ncbi:putative mitochondrial protein AtMg00860 [Nicotiana tabacum]|uniref:Mitochondrial protein AtMg00860 n=1 Tax=Nicotiana tabacum TaxID=4097 RepID=A0AC58UBT6_TOBAC
MDQQNVSAVWSWSQLNTLKRLRGFLGLTGYYRRFIKNYGLIARPLHDLLKKGSFVWNSLATEAFEALKKAITSAPVLTLPDFSKEFVIETDASGEGIGAVLMQDNKPISFFSKGLSENNKALSVYERELLALVTAVQK